MIETSAIHVIRINERAMTWQRYVNRTYVLQISRQLRKKNDYIDPFRRIVTFSDLLKKSDKKW